MGVYPYDITCTQHYNVPSFSACSSDSDSKERIIIVPFFRCEFGGFCSVLSTYSGTDQAKDLSL